MIFTCARCGETTDVNSVQMSRYDCDNCNDYVEGNTVPECGNCGNHEIPMVQIDEHEYVCPNCGIYRSSRQEHLSNKGNPTYICPILNEQYSKSELEKSHWKYENPEVFIRVSREAHEYLHDGRRLLHQERHTRLANGREAVLKNLIELDMKRIDIERSKYNPLRKGGTYAEYVLARYGFPQNIDANNVVQIFNDDSELPVDVPQELKETRLELFRKRNQYR